MNPQQQFCPNPACHAGAKAGHGHIVIHMSSNTGKLVIRSIFTHLLSGRANSLRKNPDLRKKTSIIHSSLVSR